MKSDRDEIHDAMNAIGILPGTNIAPIVKLVAKIRRDEKEKILGKLKEFLAEETHHA